MKRYRVEIILGLVFVAILLAYGQFVSGGPKLTQEEVAGFVAKIDKGLKMPGPMRSGWTEARPS